MKNIGSFLSYLSIMTLLVMGGFVVCLIFAFCIILVESMFGVSGDILLVLIFLLLFYAD